MTTDNLNGLLAPAVMNTISEKFRARSEPFGGYYYGRPVATSPGLMPTQSSSIPALPAAVGCATVPRPITRSSAQ